MSGARTSPDTLSAISSPGLEDGRSPCESLASVQTSLFGPEAVHVNPFRAPAKERARWTKGTSGLSGTASLRSAVLTRSMESRLRAVMDLNGSMEYRLTWKNLAMPSGRVIFRLRASARQISDNAYGGWPTPKSTEHQQAHKRGNPTLYGAAKLSGWQTPKCPSGGAQTRRTSPGGGLRKLEDQAALAGWQTPTVNDSKGSDYSYIKGPGGKRVKFQKLPRQAKLAGWASPDAQAMNVGADPEKHIARLARLKQKHGNGNGAGCTLGAQAGMISGLILNSAGVASQVEVESGAVLNPEHSRWLQGYPRIWGSCGATAMRSIRGSRRSSSGRT